MKLINVRGREVNVGVSKYSIDWDSKSASQLQTDAKRFFRPYWIGMVVLEEFRIPGSLLRCDFVNLTKKLVVEINGGQHGEFNKFFHGNRTGYLQSIRRDYTKLKWSENNGFTFIEIEEKEVAILTPDFFRQKFGVELV